MKKKRILIAVNHFEYSNGVATALRNMLANINYQKYEITLLPIYKFDHEFAEPIIDKIRVINGFGLYFRGLDKIVNLIPLKILYRFLIKEKYDIEVSYQYGVPTKLIAHSTCNNKACWIHTYDEGLTLRKYYEKYKQLVTVAKAGYEKLIKDGMNPAACTYCYNIIDQDMIYSKVSEDVGRDTKGKTIFVTVARIDHDKAFERLFKCIRNIQDKIKNKAEFWVIGGGSEEIQLRRYIKDENLDDTIIMFGSQTNPYKYMAKADLYLCASYREGFSTSCQEAAILGIPVISTKVDGAEELVSLSKAGCIIENNEDGIINGILYAIENRKETERWKKEAQNNKTLFYKEHRISMIEQLFDQMSVDD